MIPTGIEACARLGSLALVFFDALWGTVDTFLLIYLRMSKKSSNFAAQNCPMTEIKGMNK